MTAPTRFALAALVLASALAGEATAARYVSSSGSDATRCTRAQPCHSFDRAYRLARFGETVYVGSGRYGGQTIRSDPRKRSPRDVVFRPTRGGRVTVEGSVTVYGSHVEFRGMRFAGGWTVKEGTKDVTFRGIKSKHLFIESATGIRVIGGSIGPGVDYDSQIKAASPTAPPSRNILIHRVNFHDWTISPGSGAHVECLQIGDAHHVTIRRSKFRRCTHFSVFASPWWGTTMDHITFENNWGDTTLAGFYSFRVTAPGMCSNILFRNNSAIDPMLVDCGGGSNVRLIANLAPFSPWLCEGYIRYVHNVWRGAKCGSTDKNVAVLGFVDVAGFDLHLRRGAPAVGAGDPASYPARDIDGQRRPRGKQPDAGADEL